MESIRVDYLLVGLSLFFLVVDFLLSKKKIYKILKNKLAGRYTLRVNLQNMDYKFRYQAGLFLLNAFILNAYALTKILIFFSAAFCVYSGHIFMFFLTALLIAFSLGVILFVKRFKLNSYVRNQTALALERISPEAVICFGAPSPRLSMQLEMWLPYLEKTGLNLYIMVRESKHMARMKMLAPNIPVVHASSLVAVERYLPRSVKLAFYVNNGMKNVHLVRFNHLLHIQLFHGDSEKPSSYNPVSKMYDKLFVCGQRAIDRYYENDVVISEQAFEVIGRPQVSNIKLYNKNNADDQRVTILFAPTWLGNFTDMQLSSLLLMYNVISYLLSVNNDFKIILRLHPFTDKEGSLVKEQLEKIERLLSGGDHLLYSDRNIVEDFNESNLIVTDISSVPIDYLYSEKPIVHIDVNNLSQHFKEQKKYEKYATCVYMINEDFNNMEDVFSDVFSDDSLLQQRKLVKAYYHGDFDKPLEDVFVDKVHELFDKHKSGQIKVLPSA